MAKEVHSKYKYGKKAYYRSVAKSNWFNMSGLSGGMDVNTFSRYSIPLSREVLRTQITEKQPKKSKIGKTGKVATKCKSVKETDKVFNRFTLDLELNKFLPNLTLPKKGKVKSAKAQSLSEGFFRNADGDIYHYVGKSLYRYNDCCCSVT